EGGGAEHHQVEGVGLAGVAVEQRCEHPGGEQPAAERRGDRRVGAVRRGDGLLRHAGYPVLDMAELKTTSSYSPTGDQPGAIETLAAGLEAGERYQTLLGATGTGKTATMAWIIEKIRKPALVIAHNKTLAAQLCHEFPALF